MTLLRPILVFDLDGTLVDTASDLVASINHVLVTEGFEALDKATLGGLVGMGGRAMLSRAYELAGRRIDAEVLERHNLLFLDHYAASIPGDSRPYPGVLETIAEARQAGFVLAVCTNKPEAMAVALLDRLGLAEHFEAVTGGDTFPFRKPDPRHLLFTIERAGGDPGQALMIGDSRTDIDTAKAAGIPVAAVDFGYTDRHVREFEPTAVISHFNELSLPLIRKLIRAANG
jgi:phosphoglycolate phosphatase